MSEARIKRFSKSLMAVAVFSCSLLIMASGGMSFADEPAVAPIDVNGGTVSKIQIAIVPFRFGEDDSRKPPVDIAAVITADLDRSGRFTVLKRESMLYTPHSASEIKKDDWFVLGMKYVVVGRISDSGGGEYKVSFDIFDVSANNVISGIDNEFSPQEGQSESTLNSEVYLRGTAHQIADTIYYNLIGQPGDFNSKIAYVVASPAGGPYTSYSLMSSDADGYNPNTLIGPQNAPILTPAWSTKWAKLSYVTFEHGHAEIYQRDTTVARSSAVADYPGVNASPAWHPKQSYLLASLSKDGSPQIYSIDLTRPGSNSARRLTKNSSIDTEPVYSPDGSSIVFTSDRTGVPQLYRMATRGGGERQLTRRTPYAAHAQFSPDGKSLVFLNGDGVGTHISILDLASGNTRDLTNGPSDNSPSFSPNGSLIIYSSLEGGRPVLKVISLYGDQEPQIVKTPDNGDLRDPAWGPYYRSELTQSPSQTPLNP